MEQQALSEEKKGQLNDCAVLIAFVSLVYGPSLVKTQWQSVSFCINKDLKAIGKIKQC